MATAYTSLLGLALPVTGELSGSWGDTVNDSITSLLDSAISGTTTLSTDADVTLTSSDGVADQARQAILLWTAGGSTTRNITAPAHSKAYFVINKTSSTQSIVIRGVGPTTGVTVLAGTQSLVVWNGVDFVEVASGNVDGPASSTDNAVARFDGTTGKLIQNSVVTIADTTGNMAGVGTLGVGAITTSGALTYGGVTLSNSVTGTGSMVLATSPTLTTPALGTPSALVGTNITGTAAGLTAGNVTTNANLTGAITSTGNATVLGSFSSANLAGALTDETGTGSAVFATSPTLVTPALGTPSSGTVTNLTGTASININGTVGATTANTGAFTTITTSSTVTLNGATANGVAYADGSKVLTTGSALTFDGTALAPDGTTRTLGTTALRWGTVYATAFADGTDQLVGSSGAQARFGYGAGWTSQAFAISGSEQMRLNSTGLGIGTSSPDAKLQVQGTSGSSAYLRFGRYNGYSGGIEWRSYSASGGWDLKTGTGSNADLIFSRTEGSGNYIFNDANLGIGTSSPGSFEGAVKTVIGGGSGNPILTLYGGNATYGGIYFADGTTGNEKYRGFFEYDHASDALRIGTTGSTRATLDASGNLGLGVTPSAWATLSKGLEVGTYGAVSSNSSTGGAYLSNNAYLSTNNDTTGWVYETTDGATLYKQGLGFHQWSIAASGTAGNAITFSQVMTLDASGNLGIGTSSPTARVHAYSGTAMTQITADGTGAIKTGINFASGGTTYGQIYFDNNSPYDMSVMQQYSTGSLRFGTNNTERARIDASGNLGIGTSSPNYPLTIYKATFPLLQFINSASGTAGGDGLLIYLNGTTATISNEESGSITFQTAGTLRATLDASGNLGLGVTPSAWSTSSQNALQILSAGVSGNVGGNTASRFTHACYLDGSTWKYQYTSVGPARYEITGPDSGSTHSWSIAAGGTAGNAITFTQAMTLDASGNLGIGLTSPSQKLSVGGNMAFHQSSNLTTTTGYLNIAPSSTLILDTGDTVQFRTSGTERARITSGGDLIQTVNTTAATLTTNGTLTFSIVDNSTLRISVRGSDGTTRTATVALT